MEDVEINCVGGEKGKKKRKVFCIKGRTYRIQEKFVVVFLFQRFQTEKDSLCKS